MGHFRHQPIIEHSKAGNLKIRVVQAEQWHAIAGVKNLRKDTVDVLVLDPFRRSSAQEIARSLAKKCTPLSVAEAKKNFYRYLSTDLAFSLADTEVSSQLMNKSDDFKEAVRAFTEKRSPQFKGR
jgi:enoyl-CoA hydratase/carnithine racemase